MKYRAVIFDFDGVILNSHKIKSKAMYKIFRQFGEKVGLMALNYHLKNIGKPRLLKFKYINEFYLKKSIKKSKIKLIEKQFQSYIFKKITSMSLNKNLKKLLTKLKKKRRLYISTGTNEKEIKKICKILKIDKFFFRIHGSPKSKNYHINEILKKNKKQETIFIGDSASDCDVTKKNKIKFICKSNSENSHLFKNKKIKSFK